MALAVRAAQTNQSRKTQVGWLLGTACLRLRPRDRTVDSGYLRFYLSHPQVKDWILRNGSGSNPPSLAATVLETLPTHLPPLDRQIAIGIPKR